jgi:DNA polymerase (family 10)
MDAPETPPILSNGELARIFHEIGDMLEVKGELVFKTVAYHKAADAIAHSPVEVSRAYLDGAPPRIPGSARPSRRRSRSWREPGRLVFYDRLREEVPPSLVALLGIPGVGPRTVKQLHEELGVETLDDLRRAAEAGGSARPQGHVREDRAGVLSGIAALETRQERMRLGQAEAIVETLLAELSASPGLRSIQPAGSFRRRRETIGDLDLLAETDRPPNSSSGSRRLGSVESVIAKGPHKAAVRLMRGPQVDLMIMPPGEAGTYLIHFTGSKEHNVRLRGMARDMGWSLSEKGYLRLGDDGEPRTGRRGGAADLPDRDRGVRLPGPAVHRAGAARGPRRGRGGPGRHAAGAGDAGRPARRLPQPLRLVGRHPLDRADGGGGPPARILVPGPDRPHDQPGDRPRAIARAGRDAAVRSWRRSTAFRGRGAAGTAPPETSAEGFRLLHGCELEIRADATLDYPDELLARYDLVVASRPRLAAAVPRPADRTGAGRHPEPERRRHRPPGRPVHRLARRPRPGLGHRSSRRRPEPARPWS